MDITRGLQYELAQVGLLDPSGEDALLMAPPGPSGRDPQSQQAARLATALRRYGFLARLHFVERLVQRGLAQGVRFDPQTFAREFARARHYRQTRPGYTTRIAVVRGLPILYRPGGPQGGHIVLVGVLPPRPQPHLAVELTRIEGALTRPDLETVIDAVAQLEATERVPGFENLLRTRPHLNAGLTRIEDALRSQRRKDLGPVIDAVSKLDTSISDPRSSKVYGFEGWVRNTAPREHSQVVDAAVELLEARRLLNLKEIAGDPTKFIRLEDHDPPRPEVRAPGVPAKSKDRPRSFDIQVEQAGRGVARVPGKTTILRQVEVRHRRPLIRSDKSLIEGVTHGAQVMERVPPKGATLPGKRESTIVVNWSSQWRGAPLGGDAVRRFGPHGHYVEWRKRANSSPIEVGRGHIGNDLADRLNRSREVKEWRDGPDGQKTIDERVRYLTAVNVVNRSGHLVFRLENSGGKRGDRNWRQV